jgi:hypothetical protein
MGMLYQIVRNLENLREEIAMQRKDVVEKMTTKMKVAGEKVVAISVPPDMYVQLQAVAKKHDVQGVRPALFLAAKAGIRELLR